jgi:arginase family enzyme
MILEDFLAPVSGQAFEDAKAENSRNLAHHILIHDELEGLPPLTGVKMALLGVMEDRGALRNSGCDEGPEAIRGYLYRLMPGSWNAQVADLGNIYKGETLQDTHFAVKQVCHELLKQGIIPIVLGGSQDITYSAYRGYDGLEQSVNLALIDNRFDLGNTDESLNSKSFLSHIILQKPYLLFNCSLMGYQTYFTLPEEIDLMDRMHFEAYRLGVLRENLREAEPLVRDADIVSFDLSAIRQSDCPGTAYGSPNGFTGEQACAIARYAGLSDKVSTFGLFEYNPELDHNGLSAHLAAQMVWYFIEGWHARKGDYPFGSKKDYLRFTVLINEGEHELVFYKSPRSERWWMEVPMASHTNPRLNRHTLVPCSYEDYQRAIGQEIPERWWRAYKKGI